MLKITRSIMNSTNTSKAVNKLRKFLSANTQWHNEKKFPENESNAKAFKACSDKESAKKFCPVRYAALKRWIAACREIMALIHPQFIYAFHVTGICKLLTLLDQTDFAYKLHFLLTKNIHWIARLLCPKKPIGDFQFLPSWLLVFQNVCTNHVFIIALF